MLGLRLRCSHKSFERVYQTRELRENISVDVYEPDVAVKEQGTHDLHDTSCNRVK